MNNNVATITHVSGKLLFFLKVFGLTGAEIEIFNKIIDDKVCLLVIFDDCALLYNWRKKKRFPENTYSFIIEP